MTVQRPVGRVEVRPRVRRIHAGRATGSNETSGPVTIETLAAFDVQKMAEEETRLLLDGARRAARLAASQRPPTAAAVPWDRPRRGRWDAFWATAQGIGFAPAAFFSRMSAHRVAPALWYAAIVLTPAAVAQSLTIGAWLPSLFQGALAPASGRLLLFLGLMPLVVAYLSALYYLTATMLSPRRVLFAGVLRVTCYGFAPMLVAAIPGFGLIVAIPWTFALHAVGIREHFGLGAPRALVVVSAPLVPGAVALLAEVLRMA